MKKILLMCLLLGSTLAFAYEDQVIITITNSTNSDCVLTNSTLLYGYISDGSQLPNEIFRDQTIEFKMRSEEPLRFGVRKDKMFRLTYHCAEDQEVTLFANISPFQDSVFPDPRISTSASTKHMQVKTKLISTYPIQVKWTLTP